MLADYIGNYSRYEIERKFLLKTLPISLPHQYVDIEDNYLGNSSLRLRIERSEQGEIIGRKLTKKDKASDKGPETSIITSLYLSESDLLALGELKGSTLKKRRYIYEDKLYRIVYDQFKNNLAGLILAEIEFKDHPACAAFVPPYSDWQEVTGDPNYSGGTLAFSAQAH